MQRERARCRHVTQRAGHVDKDKEDVNVEVAAREENIRSLRVIEAPRADPVDGLPGHGRATVLP